MKRKTTKPKLTRESKEIIKEIKRLIRETHELQRLYKKLRH